MGRIQACPHLPVSVVTAYMCPTSSLSLCCLPLWAMSLMYSNYSPKPRENLPHGAAPLSTPEGRDLGHFLPISPCWVLSCLFLPAGKGAGVVSSDCAHSPVLSPPQAVPAHGGAMPCASVIWGQLFWSVEKVSISTLARMHSGSWKSVGTLGLLKTTETGVWGQLTWMGGGPQGSVHEEGSAKVLHLLAWSILGSGWWWCHSKAISQCVGRASAVDPAISSCCLCCACAMPW